MFSPICLYLTAYYWMTMTSMQINFGELVAENPAEMYFIIVTMLIGVN